MLITLRGHVKLLLGFVDEALGRLHALGPFGPAAVVQAPVLLGEPGLGERSVDDGGRDARATAADNGLRGVDALGREDGAQLVSGKEGLGRGVQQVGYRHRDGVWDVAGFEAWSVLALTAVVHNYTALR